jgi:hypothetical protein
LPRATADKAPAATLNINLPQQQPPEAAAAEVEEKSPTWFWEMIHQIAADDWGKKYDLLLLREGTSKVPMAEGFKGYLETLYAPIKPDYIKQKYGGGKFKIVLEKNSRYETSHTFEIEGQPLYDLSRERPGASPAASAVAGSSTDSKLLQILEGQISKLNDQLATSQAQGRENPALHEAITILSTAYKEGIANIGAGGGNGGGSIIETIRTLKELGLIGGASAGGGVVETIKVLKEIGLIGGQQNDPMGQLNSMLAIFTKLDELRGGGEGKPTDWKTMAVNKLGEHLPELLTTVKETVSANAAVAQERRRAMEAQRETASVLRSQSVPAAAPAAPAANPAPPQPTVISDGGLRTVPINSARAAAPAEEQPAPVDGFDTNNEAYITFVKQRVVQLVVTGSSGESIVDFLDGAKPEFAQQLIQYPVEAVTSFFRADPILATAVAHPRWNDVLEEARAYILENEEAAGNSAPN